MLKELLEALKTKFPGVNENILNRIATKKANTVTTTEQVKAVVDGMTLQNVIDSYADHRATEASQTAVRNYETTHNLRDGKPVQTPAPVISQNPNPAPSPTEGGAPSATEQLLHQLLEQNKKLNERLDRMDGERTTADRRQQLSEITNKLPENLRAPYSRIAVESLSDEEFSKMKGEITTEVDGIVSAYQSKGAVFGRPNAPQGGSPNPNDLTKEQTEAIAARNGAPKSDSQPF